MSSTPKYNSAQLDAMRRAQLERERKQRAEEEARQRREAEERERQRRLEMLPSRLAIEARIVIAELERQQQSLSAEDYQRLRKRSEDVLRTLEGRFSENEFQRAVTEAAHIMKDIGRARKAASLDVATVDEEYRDEDTGAGPTYSANVVPSQTGHSQFDNKVDNVDRPYVVEPAVAKESNRKTVPMGTAHPKANSAAALERHAQNLLKKTEAERTLCNVYAIAEGLKADPIVMRWHKQSVDKLSAEVDRISAEVEAGHYASIVALLDDLRARSEQIVGEANAAQIKADQRDYVAASISQTLKEMGFIVGPLRAEHAGHPASAVILQAANSVGKGIDVSVPVEGQVWYNMGGYPKSTETVLGGGSAPVCDEAEAVLNDMRQRLQSECGVQTSEVLWSGKPKPTDRLSTARNSRTQAHSDQTRGGSA